ncbi:MAG: hypothetical protein ACR2O4_16300 [Hyphomicrobiaceae bacterium]
MTLRCLKLFTLLAAMLVVAPAAAEDVKIGAASITLTHPDEFCPFDKSNPSDSRVISMIVGGLAGRNRLLGGYAKCDDLQRWRTGKQTLLGDMLQHQTMIALMGRDIPKPYAAYRKQFCDQFRNQGQTLIDKISPDVNKRISSMSADIAINEQRMFGVVNGEDERCYVLLLQKIKAETGETFVQLAVFSPVIVKSKMIFTYLFVRFDEEVGGQPTVNRLSKIAANMEKANGE